jgi:hypothetical protein
MFAVVVGSLKFAQVCTLYTVYSTQIRRALAKDMTYEI